MSELLNTLVRARSLKQAGKIPSLIEADKSAAAIPRVTAIGAEIATFAEEKGILPTLVIGPGIYNDRMLGIRLPTSELRGVTPEYMGWKLYRSDGQKDLAGRMIHRQVLLGHDGMLIGYKSAELSFAPSFGRRSPEIFGKVIAREAQCQPTEEVAIIDDTTGNVFPEAWNRRETGVSQEEGILVGIANGLADLAIHHELAAA